MGRTVFGDPFSITIPNPDHSYGEERYNQVYQRGHTVKIHHTDGTVEIHEYALEDGAVLLAPDVREYFPDSEAVNTALRTLISLVHPKKPRRKRQQKEPVS